MQATTRPLQSQTQKCFYTMILVVYATYSEIYGRCGTWVSQTGEIWPAGAVNMIGRVTRDATKLQEKMSEAQIRVQRAA